MSLPQENVGDKGTNVPISTQPSSDEIKREIREDWLFVSNPTEEQEPFFWRWTDEGLTDLAEYIQSLLRSQQKELLERVRMEVIGNDVPIYDKPLTEHLSPIAKWQNELRSEQRKALDAIEREL